MSVEMKVLTMAGTAYEIVDAKSRENVDELKNTKIDKSPTEWPIWTSEEQDTAREKMGAVSNSDLNWGNISGKPSSFPPTSHTHTASEVGAATVDHTHTPASIGAAATSHTHTPASIGAAATDHTHDDRYYTESELDSKLSGKSDTNHTHSTLNSPDGSELLYCYSNDGDTKTLLQTKSNSGDYSYCQFGNNTFYTGEGYRVYAEDYKPALTDLSGTLAVANGGTGATTAATACANIGAVKKSGDTMTGGLTTTGLMIKSSNLYPALSLRASEQDESSGSIASNASTRRIYFTNYCSDSDYKEAFLTPTPTTGRTSDGAYNILTSKNAVTVAQGGTGASTAAQARHNIGADHDYNLLINSYFKNPVNSLGIASGDTVAGYASCIDRWMNYSGNAGTLEFNNDGIVPSFNFCQILSEKIVPNGMVVTASCKWSDGTIQIATGTISRGSAWTWFNSGEKDGCVIGVVDNGSGASYVRIDNTNGKTLEWAALYEGSYTADTLPAYVPYPKQVEMIRCGVSLTPYNLLDNSWFVNPVNQRGITEASENGYFIDRWGNYNGTSKVTSSGIQVNADKNSSAFLYQYIKGLRDGTYTLAAKVNGNTVLRVIQISGTTATTIDGNKAGYTGGYLVFMYANDDKFEFDFRVESGATITVEWAALYEGIYTADTLPPYVPKGYAAELAECQRYYYPVRVNAMRERDSDNLYACSCRINMRTTPTVTLTEFAPYGQNSITDFTNCSVSAVQDYIFYARLPTCLAHNFGGLAMTLSADL